MKVAIRGGRVVGVTTSDTESQSELSRAARELDVTDTGVELLDTRDAPATNMLDRLTAELRKLGFVFHLSGRASD